MAVIRVDPEWVSGYASTVAAATDELSRGAEIMRTAPLDAESFGALGRNLRVTESYNRAAEALRGQVTRGVEALESAATSLAQVAEKYRTSDGDGVQTINRSGQA